MKKCDCHKRPWAACDNHIFSFQSYYIIYNPFSRRLYSSCFLRLKIQFYDQFCIAVNNCIAVSIRKVRVLVLAFYIHRWPSKLQRKLQRASSALLAHCATATLQLQVFENALLARQQRIALQLLAHLQRASSAFYNFSFMFFSK